MQKGNLLLLFSILICKILSSQITADFTSNRISGCPPLVVNFQDLSTGPVTAWNWDFDGQASTSNLQNPSVSFFNSGNFDITLIVTDGAGNFDTIVKQINVFQPPIVNFTVPDSNICVPYTVNFTDATIPGSAPITQWAWDLGTPPVLTTRNVAYTYTAIGNYSVTLVVNDANGCSGNIIKTNFIHAGDKPLASFTTTPSNLNSCTAPFNVSFNSTSTGSNITYLWNFGDAASGAANTSTLANPSHTYNSAGSFVVKLIVTTDLGCKDSITKTVNITSIAPDFTASATSICANRSVSFTNTSIPTGTSWSWNFGDVASGAANSSTAQNPSHTYSTAGSYTVTLTTTINGCSNTVTKTNFITVLPAPIGTFTANDTVDCRVPKSITFSTNFVPTPSTYSWSFASGSATTTSILASPTISYTAYGIHDVSLTVTNSIGCSTVVNKPNYINIEAPSANFTTNVDSGCANLLIKTKSTSSSNSGIASYTWTWGDATPNTVTTVDSSQHIYTTAGNFTIRLIVRTVDNCYDTAYRDIKVGLPFFPDFTVDKFMPCLADTPKFTLLTPHPFDQIMWDFGDGSISGDSVPKHKFIDTGCHDITLTVIKNGCRVDTTKRNFVCSPLPQAKFNIVYNCQNPQIVQFNDTSIGGNCCWQWTFGDLINLPNSSTLQNPSHTYPANGSYPVKLIVGNTLTGCTDSLTKNVIIGITEAKFNADTTTGCVPLKVTFRDSSVLASSWRWDFGDPASGGSNTSTLQNPVHTYSRPGQYTVTLIVSSGSCSDTIVRQNYIYVKGVAVDFIADTTKGCAPFLVNFTNLSVPFNTVISYYSWQFGDGDSSNVINPSHTYVKSQTFNVKLSILDTSGCKSVITKNTYINTSRPVASFKGDTLRCLGEIDSFTNTSTGATTYLWDFGDGNTSTLKNPKHAYQNYGYYTVTLKAMNAVGCDSTLTKTLYVHVDSPSVGFSITNTFSPCPPFVATFTNTTVRRGMTFLWDFGDGRTDTSSTTNVTHVYYVPGLYTVKLIGSTKFGCKDTFTVINVVNVLGPFGQFSTSIDSGCTPLKVTINGNTNNAATIKCDLGNGVILDDSTNFTYTYNFGGTFQIKYILCDTNGCCVTYIVDTIHALTTPLPDLPRDTSICEGNFLQFNLPGTGTFQWLPDTFLSCGNCANPLFTGTDTATYIVNVFSTNSCNASDTITINVEEIPRITVPDSITLCRNEIYQMNTGNVWNAAWTPPTYMNDTSLIKPTIQPPLPIVYYVTSVNRLGCSLTKRVGIGIIDKINIDAFMEDSICQGEQIQLYTEIIDSTASGLHYKWTPKSSLNRDSLATVLASPNSTTTYQVIASGGTCIPDTETVEITVYAKPTIKAGDDQIVTPNAPVQIYMQTNQPSGTNYEWIPNTNDDIACLYCRVTTFKPKTTQFIIAEVTSANGCKNRDTVYLRVFECDAELIFVPTVFTPNADNQNDVLYVRSEILSKLDYFRVYDRWGNMVFQTTDLKQGWDGNIAGREAQTGVYVYSISGKCTNDVTVLKSGNVTILR